jgi:hypothetical protein
MNPEYPFKGRPRRWYAIPFVAGIFLIVVSILIVAIPILLRILVALPLALVGLGLALMGLDLWHGVRDWRGRVRSAFWREGPPEDLE